MSDPEEAPAPLAPIDCLVPARMASTRFPGKPLVPIDGVPLVVRAAFRGVSAACFGRVVVCSEDRIIVETARAHGLEALLTPIFATGTDRVAWAAQSLGCRAVVNLQGDEPLFPLDLLRSCAWAVKHHPGILWSAAETSPLDAFAWTDPDRVKVRLGRSDDLPGRTACDFDRQPTDFDRSGWFTHVGLYGADRDTLAAFSALAESGRESARRIEPLRWLDAGRFVRCLEARFPVSAVDLPKHIFRVRRLLREQRRPDSDAPPEYASQS